MNYDVFISCKSEDYKIAEEIYHFLNNNGVYTFLSSKELRLLKDADYLNAISEALDSACHLIVVASSKEYITSQWVQFEWTTFLNEKLSGRKSGQIMTLLDKVEVCDLPIQLRHFESFGMNDFKDKILYYVGKNLPVIPVPPKSIWPKIVVDVDFSRISTDTKDKIQKAENGNAFSQYVIASYYFCGDNGFNKNDYEAAKWFRFSAEQGYANAQYWLGCFYQQGKGGLNSDEEAAKWWLKAAENGDIDAQRQIAYWYEEGIYVKKSVAEAISWYRKAAEQGDKNALNHLKRLGQ